MKSFFQKILKSNIRGFQNPLIKLLYPYEMKISSSETFYIYLSLSIGKRKTSYGLRRDIHCWLDRLPKHQPKIIGIGLPFSYPSTSYIDFTYIKTDPEDLFPDPPSIRFARKSDLLLFKLTWGGNV